MAYDTENKTLVARGGKNSSNSTFHFDVTSLTWKKVGEEKEVPGAHDKRTLFGYDPAGKVCLMVDKASSSIWAHSVKDKSWKKLPIKGAPLPGGKKLRIGYFDPARNVFVLIRRQEVWVYRNKKAGGKK